MTRNDFTAELGGIQALLREYQYLQYSLAGHAEYEQKVRTCAEQFGYLVFRKTRIPVRALPGLVPIESVREPSYSAGKSMAERAAKRARALAKKAIGLNREYYSKCAMTWERALSKLNEPDVEQ